MSNENQELASGASGCAQRGEVESEKSRAAIAAHLERHAQAVRVPQSADEVIAFIGSQFESREDADNPESVRFQLTVHDLQSAFRWWFDTDFAAPSAAAPAAPTEPTEIAAMLRKRASQPMANQDDAKLMLTAADECDRFYGGMMAWKSTAEKKDRDWNAERMARVNERCVARAAAQAAPASQEGAHAARNAVLEEAALAAEKVQDVYRERQSGKWPELRDDAETGAGDCVAVIRGLKTPASAEKGGAA